MGDPRDRGEADPAAGGSTGHGVSVDADPPDTAQVPDFVLAARRIELDAPPQRHPSLSSSREVAQSLSLSREVASWASHDRKQGESGRDGIILSLRRRLAHLAMHRDLPEVYAESGHHGQFSEAPEHISRTVPVSIYIADQEINERVEAAVETWLGTADLLIDERDEPVIGSWFRAMRAKVAQAVHSPAGQEAVLTAAHMADSRLVQGHDAYVTATLLQNLGPVLQSLQPTKDAAVRVGALLIVKVDWIVQVHQLSAAQQAILDHQPHLAASPQEIVEALQLTEPLDAEVVTPPTSQ